MDLLLSTNPVLFISVKMLLVCLGIVFVVALPGQRIGRYLDILLFHRLLLCADLSF